MATNKAKSKQAPMRDVIGVLCAAVIVLAVAVLVLINRPVKVVTNFEDCRDAGGVLLESYPEQCMINKTSFTNTAQKLNNNRFDDADTYIGMTEDDALAKAKKENTAARVVERDGEALPVTMDFSYGRHNLYIKDGKVYKVDIEGQAKDDK